MEYKIIGNVMPLVEFNLERGEIIRSEAGAMKFMDGDMKMETQAQGGVGGFIKRKMMGETGFLNIYTAVRDYNRIAFGHSFPGHIIPVEITNRSIICQKRTFLCATEGVDLEVYLQKRLGTGIFGGEGFVLQRLVGEGLAFTEIDGEVVEIELESGQSIKVETGSVGMFEESVDMNIERVKGFKNMLFGGEGLFLTTLRGPGKVWLQTMPIQSMVGELTPFLNIPSSN
ncbi:TIGR00266 family protein [Natronospora cellulosivora (SeqCode)]